MATTPRKTSTTTTRKPAARKAPARKPAAKTTTRKAPAKAAAAPARTAHSASMAALGTLAVAALGAVAYGAWRLFRPTEGTEPVDLMGDEHPNGSERALDAFRPDPTAPVPASEREQFRPALAQLGNSVS